MNLAQNYANLLKGGIDVAKTLTYMKTKGHLSLLPQILRSLERGEKADNTVTVARERDVTGAKKRFPDAAVVIDEKIVGGYLARKGSKLIDATHRKALVTIYKNAVN